VMILRRHHIRYHSDTKVVGRFPSTFVYAALWVLLGPVLHILYETQGMLWMISGRAITNLQTICHFINSHSSV
jgi:hypothetical protein